MTQDLDQFVLLDETWLWGWFHFLASPSLKQQALAVLCRQKESSTASSMPIRIPIKLDPGYFCKQSNPCHHTCTIHYNDGTSEERMMNVRAIYRFCQLHHLSITPHFARYSTSK